MTTSYRAELDGLRAIAVSLVVLYHAGFSTFSGGFVGVDVFFVLSGFFMTAVIMKEIDAGTFDIARFYARRIRRIVPALVAVLIITSGLSLIFFMPQELERFAKSVRTVALFYPNVAFEKESGYFDLSAHLKPLLHTWSLGVEEQFYFIFPLYLMILNKWLRPKLLIILISSLLASFVLSVWTVFSDPTAAFYLLPYRLWELMVGAVVALAPLSYSRSTACVLSSLGIAGIFSAALLFDNTTTFPGMAAALPCLSTALLLSAGNQTRWPVVILGNRAVAFVGKISYSMYLWHWPIIVFFPYVAPGGAVALQKVTIVALTLVAGYFSWRFIEQPFRFGQPSLPPKVVFLSAGAPIPAAIIFTAFVTSYDGLPNRLPPEARQLYMATYDMGPYFDPRCFADSDGAGLTASDVRAGKVCAIGDTSKEPSFLLWGDSHSAAIAPAIDAAAKKHHLAGMFVARGSCPPLLSTDFSSAQNVARCEDFNNAALEYAERRAFPFVFLAGYWPRYVHRAELPNHGIFFSPEADPPVDDWSGPVKQGLNATVSRLSGHGAQVILIMDVPEMGYAVPEALARAKMTGGSLDIAPPLEYVAKRQALARRVISEVAAETSSRVVDPMPAVCDKHACRSTFDDVVLYRDSDHLTGRGAIAISAIFDDAMREISGKEKQPSPTQAVTQNSDMPFR